MLDSDEKKKIETYVDRILKDLKRDAYRNIQAGMPNKQVIDKLSEVTVNKFTPESKMILSSTYNMLMKKTFDNEKYLNPKNKAAFYEVDILKELNGKFDFKIPQSIDYQENTRKINKWIVAGAIIVVGSAISISLKSAISVGIAVVIAAIMVLVLKNESGSKSGDIKSVVDKYLDNVRQSILLWVTSIEEYYDKQEAQVERRLADKCQRI